MIKNFETFVKAIGDNDLNSVQFCFHPDFINDEDKNKMTPLQYASNEGRLDIVKFLIEKQADIEAASSANDYRALHWASANGFSDVVEYLLKNGARIEAVACRGYRPLHCAAVGNHGKALAVLLKYGADLNAKTGERDGFRKAEQIAKENENMDCVDMFYKWFNYDKIFQITRLKDSREFEKHFLKEKLLTKEITTNLTVLDVAVESRAVDCLEYVFLQPLDDNEIVQALTASFQKLNISANNFQQHLLLYKSIIFDQHENFEKYSVPYVLNTHWPLTGQSYLEICVKFKRRLFIQPLLQLTLEVTEAWITATELAARMDYNYLGSIIKERQQFIENRTSVKFNRLHIAVQENQVALVKYISENGLIDLNQSAARVGSPLCLALKLGYVNCANVLLKYGADVDKTDEYGQNSIHIAIAYGMLDICHTLIERSKMLDQIDCNGLSPLHIAIFGKHENLCNKLVQNGASIWTELKMHEEISPYLHQWCQSAIMQIDKTENPVSLCLKLHRTIFHSLFSNIDAQSVQIANRTGHTLLHLSAMLRLPEISQNLIDKGAMVNAVNVFHNTPIMSLYDESDGNNWQYEGFVATLEVLINNGSNVCLKNDKGLTAFRHCFNTMCKGHLGILLRNAPQVDVTTDDFFVIYNQKWPDILELMINCVDQNFLKILLKLCIDQQNCEFLDFLLEKFDESFKNGICEEFLRYCAQSNNIDVFCQFLKLKIRDPLIENGETLFTDLILNADERFCCKFIDSDLVQPYIELQNARTMYPIHCAADRGYMKVFKYLAQESEKVNEEFDGKTALEIFLRKFCPYPKPKKLEELIKTLIQSGFDIKKKLDSGAPIITLCNDEKLIKRLENFHQKECKKRKLHEKDDDEDLYLCEICNERKMDRVFDCGHPFCNECASKVSLSCPMCRKPNPKISLLYLPQS